MSSPVIQLRNRNREEATDPLQVDASSDSVFLSGLVNTLFSRESKYVFYYKSERLVQSLEYIIEKHGLGVEDVIQIDYVDEEDMQCDFVRDCNDTITGMAWFRNSLYYVTYGGLVLSLDDAFRCPLSEIKGLFSSRRLFGFGSHSIYDIEDNCEVYRLEEEIRSCSVSNDGIMAVATNDRILLLNTDNAKGEVQKMQTIPTLRFPRSIILSEHVVYWVENYNKVSFYDLKKGTKKTISCDGAINNLLAANTIVFGTTSNGRIIVISNDSAEAKDVPSRLSNHIVLAGDVILYSTQHEVIGLSCSNLQELSFVKVDGQINGVVLGNEMVYVASNQRICGFLKSRLVQTSE